MLFFSSFFENYYSFSFTSSISLVPSFVTSETSALSSFFFCSNIAASLWVAIFLISLAAPPVPAGINLPTITFSLSPIRLSRFPCVEASVRTLVVS